MLVSYGGAMVARHTLECSAPAQREVQVLRACMAARTMLMCVNSSVDLLAAQTNALVRPVATAASLLLGCFIHGDAR